MNLEITFKVQNFFGTFTQVYVLDVHFKRKIIDPDPLSLGYAHVIGYS